MTGVRNIPEWLWYKIWHEFEQKLTETLKNEVRNLLKEEEHARI